jgi:arsenite methyltransferase
MREPKSRLDEMNNIILNVANKSGSSLDLSKIPDSQLKLPVNVLKAIPASFKNETIVSSLVYGLDFFSPGMKAMVMGGKNHVLNYIAVQKTAPGGMVINCFSDPNHLKKAKTAFKGLPKKQLANLQFFYTPGGDLKTPYAKVGKYLEKKSIDKIADYWQFENYISAWRSKNPLIEDNSVDIAAVDVPNSGITMEDLWDLASDVYRILKRGGVFLLSLLISDEKAEEQGYLCENDLDRFTTHYKFHGFQWLGRSQLPHQVIDGNEIRCHNVAVFKGKVGPCLERKQALIYNGPWSEVKDDDGHVFPRGRRVAVCNKTFNVMSNSPYKDQFTYLHPYIDIPLEQAAPFPCASGILFRHPKVTKGLIEDEWKAQDDNCGPDDDCCC